MSRRGHRQYPDRPRIPHYPEDDFEADDPPPLDANAFRETELGQAIEREDFVAINEFYNDAANSRYDVIDYVIEQKGPTFIIKFIEIAKYAKWYLLGSLFSKRSEPVIEEALREGNFSQRDFIGAAGNLELMCSPEKLIKLFGRIEALDDQEEAISYGIRGLITKKRSECIEPLLTALEGDKSLNKDLANVAVQVAFVAGALGGSEILTKNLYKHPAITPGIYVYALCVAGKNGVRDPTFQWLLATASHEDLVAVRVWGYYDILGANILEALPSAKPKKTRSHIVGPRAKAVSAVTSTLVPQVIERYIILYVAEDAGNDRLGRKWSMEKYFELEGIVELMRDEERERRQTPEVEHDLTQGLESIRNENRRRAFIRAGKRELKRQEFNRRMDEAEAREEERTRQKMQEAEQEQGIVRERELTQAQEVQEVAKANSSTQNVTKYKYK